MRLIALLAVLCGTAFAAPPPTTAARQPVTIDVAGDRWRYSVDRQHVTLEGNARITITAPGYAAQQILVHANRVDVDMKHNTVETDTGGKFVIGPALFRGDSIHLDADREEFTVKGAEGMMAIPIPGQKPQDPQPLAFFRGQSIGKVGDITYVIRGLITTCDRDHPHYAIIAKRIKYNVRTGESFIYDGRLKLYGVTLPVLPWGRVRLGGGEPSRKFDPVVVPGYSSREGFFLPYDWTFSAPEAPWLAATSFRLTAKRGVTGSVWAKRSVGDWDFDADVARKEWKVDDITDRLSISRLPELNITRNFTARNNPRRQVKLDTSFGYYEESLESQHIGLPLRPEVNEARALTALSYTANPLQYAQHTGSWYGARGRVSLYTSDETFRELEVFGGAGAPVGSKANAYATLIHHFYGGNTPFLFDNVDIQTELALGGDWEIIPKFTVDGWGRYDVAETDLRDYELGLSYRAHCLTWRVFYHDVGNRIGFRVDLTGLTSNTKPYKTNSRLEREMAQEGLSIAPPVPSGAKPAPEATGRPQATPAPKP